MNSIIYIVGLVVVVGLILCLLACDKLVGEQTNSKGHAVKLRVALNVSA